MKNGLLIGVAVILIGVVLLFAQGNDGKSEKNGLPPSLDQYYKIQPPEYLVRMFGLGESFQAIVVHTLQGDKTNASESFKVFSKNYRDSAALVPEWRKYYDQKTVDRLGASVDSGDINAVFEAVGEVGAACVKCHTENMPPVWNRYNWKDFDTLKMESPEGQIPWSAAKMKYLLAGFDGIGVNINNHNQSGAKQSFGLFRMMFDNMNSTCASCHSSAPRYYVSGDVRAMIDSMGEKIDSGNMGEALDIQRGIGMESCYRCHVLHMPAQFAKAEKE